MQWNPAEAGAEAGENARNAVCSDTLAFAQKSSLGFNKGRTHCFRTKGLIQVHFTRSQKEDASSLKAEQSSGAAEMT